MKKPLTLGVAIVFSAAGFAEKRFAAELLPNVSGACLWQPAVPRQRVRQLLLASPAPHGSRSLNVPAARFAILG